MAHSGLRESERAGQMAYACFVGSLHEVQDLKASGFGDDLESGRESLGVLPGEDWTGEHRRAAGGLEHGCLHVNILTDVDIRCRLHIDSHQYGGQMSRIQLALNVSDLDAAVEFYRKLFRTEPAKLRPGYANFAIEEPPLKLVLIEGEGRGATLNHLGIEVFSKDEVAASTARLVEDGFETRTEEGVVCCYAEQDKVWVSAPDGARWEVYTVLADAPEVPPCSCSLPEAEKDERALEIRAVFEPLVLERERTASGASILLADRDGLEAELRDLIAREQVCCAFLDFSLERVGGAWRLEITGPAEAATVLDEWAGAVSSACC